MSSVVSTSNDSDISFCRIRTVDIVIVSLN